MYETIEDYEEKKRHYQDVSVASTYDEIRFVKPSDRMRNRRKLFTVQKAVTAAEILGYQIQTALDIPCGTGRLFPLFIRNKISFAGADLSSEMMYVSVDKHGKNLLLKGLVRCDAEHLPFKDNSFDSILSIRFMFHIPEKIRVNILREMCRVSRRWLIIDYRHCYTLKYWLKKIFSGVGITEPPSYRFSTGDLKREFHSAGLDVVEIFPTLRLFSDKWVVLGQKNR